MFSRVLAIVVSLFMFHSGGSMETDTKILFETFTQCDLANLTCLTTQIQKGASWFATGNASLHLGALDPMYLEQVHTKRNPNSPFNIELSFNNINLTGLASIKVPRASAKMDNQNRLTIKLEFKVPKLWLRGPYEVNGKIFILPITGKGDADIYMEGCRGLVTLVLRQLKKTKGERGYFDSCHVVLEPKRVTYKLGGLFDDNKMLAETMNTVINENALEIFAETSPAVKSAIGDVIRKTINSFFDHFTMEQLFHEYLSH